MAKAAPREGVVSSGASAGRPGPATRDHDSSLGRRAPGSARRPAGSSAVTTHETGTREPVPPSDSDAGPETAGPLLGRRTHRGDGPPTTHPGTGVAGAERRKLSTAARRPRPRPGARGRRPEARGGSPPPLPGWRVPRVAVGLASAAGSRSRLRWAGARPRCGPPPGWASCTAWGRGARPACCGTSREGGGRVCLQNSQTFLQAGLRGREVRKRGETTCPLRPRVRGLQLRGGRRTGPPGPGEAPSTRTGGVSDLPWSRGSTGYMPGISFSRLASLSAWGQRPTSAMKENLIWKHPVLGHTFGCK